MSNYTKTTDFEAKDSLPSGNTGKIIRGSEFETEFDNISTAIATKADLASPAFSGTINITSASINDGSVTISGFLDEDTMATNSASHVPTQQSVKAYVDAQTAGIVTDTDTQTLTNKTLTSPVINTGVSGTAVLDEDDMFSDSDTKLATQQSIKAYVDSSVASGALTGITDNSTQTSMVLSNGSMRILSDDLSNHIASIYGYDDTNTTSLGKLQFGASTGQNSGIYSTTAFSISNAPGDDPYTFTVDTINEKIGIGLEPTASPKYSIDTTKAIYSGLSTYTGNNYGDIPGYLYLNGDTTGYGVVGAINSTQKFLLSGGSNTVGFLTYDTTGLYIQSDEARADFGVTQGLIQFKTGGGFTERARINDDGLSVTGDISATGDITLGDTIYAKSNNQAFLKLKADQAGLAGTGGPHEWQLEADTSGNLSVNYDKNGTVTNDVVRITKGTSSSEVKLDLPSGGGAGFYASSTDFGFQINDGGVGGKTIRLVNNGTSVFRHNQVEDLVDLSGAAKTEVAKLNISNIPTSASGLSSGDVWNDSGTLKIVT